MAEDPPIKPYRIERVCESQPDIGRLTLKPDVSTRESVYTRKLVELAGAGLPGGMSCQTGCAAWDLHLMLRYRQDWSPTGYGLGDLIFTISLLPNEELTLELKTWETSKTQQDEENTTEARNVSDLKTSSSVAHELTTGKEATEQESLAGSAGWSGFGFSAAAEGEWSSEVKDMRQSVAKETQERTEQATNEYKRTHKVRMSVSREEGSEHKTTRRIRNINQAHTLNANYYEVLQEYDVELFLEGTSLLLLGLEPDLTQPIGLRKSDTESGIIYLRKQDGDDDYPISDSVPGLPDAGEMVDPGGLDVEAVPDTPDDSDEPDRLTLAQLILISHNPSSVSRFIRQHGVSPVKLLRELWSDALRDAAVVDQDLADSGATITAEQREAFTSKMLAHVRPTPGWVEPDRDGRLRWAYEVFAGRERSLLTALYSLVPYGAEQARERARIAGMDLREVDDALARRVEEVSIPVRAPQVIAHAPMRRSETVARDLVLSDNDTILAPGPFRDMPRSELASAVEEWVNKLVGQLDDVRQDAGSQAQWKAPIPTQGVYADVSLGICSGAEDYYEIQRQLELEEKKIELERMKLENERLRLENDSRRSGDPDLRISGAIDRTVLRLNVDNDGPPRSVEVDSGEEE